MAGMAMSVLKGRSPPGYQVTGPIKRQEVLTDTTVRQFDGGWDVIDTDLNLSSKYAKVLDNIERSPDGSLAVRAGTTFFTDCQASGLGNVIAMEYYGVGTVIVVVGDTGKVATIDGAGTVTIRNSSWTNPTTFATFALFNGEMILCNGVDKPLLLKANLTCAFLQDIPTVSNVNTPIGRYVVTHGNYLCIAGDPTQPDQLHISNKYTSGTWYGDSAPNTGVKIKLGSVVPLGDFTITGMSSFRDRLVVLFPEVALLIQLDVYAGTPSVHTPNTTDGAILNAGGQSHKSIVGIASELGDTLIYTDNYGVSSLARNMFATAIRPQRVSELIDPEITKQIRALTTGTVRDKVFAIHDKRTRRYRLFIPNADNPTETICYSYTSIPTLHVNAWARLRGWNFSCACRTELGNIFYASGTKLYLQQQQYDLSLSDPTLDGIGDPANPAGTPITFTWELPWAPLGERMHNKYSKYIALDTVGFGTFTVEMYTDNHLQDGYGTYTPELSMQFVGGSSGGFGNSLYGDVPFGGGRPASEERLYAWTSKFRLFKLRLSGTANASLRFVSISLLYSKGSVRR